MVYSYYTPTYYSTLQDSITSLCKTILPFSFKKRPLPAAEHKLSKLQSDNLKWQQDSFHQVLNLMGLHKEGIVAESEVSAFRTHLLDTLIASPPEQEHPVILRDKLLFLQELLYAKCISEEEYHSSKRPLLQRLAAQGAQIEARDVIVARTKDSKENSEDEWSVIDLKDEKCSMNKENSSSTKSRSNQGSAMKQIKGAASVFGFAKGGKNEKSIFDSPSLSAKNEVLGDKIKKELSRIQTELSSTNPNLKFSNDQIEAISTRIPVDKAELKNYFPKSWCDRYGDVVLDVVKKEFKDHVAEMENMRNIAREKHSNSRGWTTTTFDDDENIHPNLFGHRDNSSNINPFSRGYA
uniref:Uncharacterized protein n=1 Tax=Cajanus cajan TaxID=3821 RepID=A0A151SRJ1_CAJCA|nr:hypothetical protein KK1_003632 [Cajanus cajan]